MLTSIVLMRSLVVVGMEVFCVMMRSLIILSHWGYGMRALCTQVTLDQCRLIQEVKLSSLGLAHI